MNILVPPGGMLSPVPGELSNVQVAAATTAVHPLGAAGHEAMVHWMPGRVIWTDPRLSEAVLVFFTVKVKVVPTVSLRYWTWGLTEAVAATAAWAGRAIPTTSTA